MVVLANRNSASASEIFTGALQDHDRAYIVGETTFGKALVQSVYRISGGAGLALTTAHYYTPSGRLIQRPWDETFDEYLSFTQREQDANKAHNPSDLKKTDAGRPVYSGGGIEPDKYVAGQMEGFSPTPFGRMLYGRQEFENYAQKFTADGDTRISQQATGRRSVAPNFTVDEAMLNEFREQLKTNRIKMDEEAFKKDREFIRAMIRFRIDEAVFGISEARRHLIMVDPQAQVATTMFGEAQKLGGLTKGTAKAN
jgi:carboxyl-terminal processing protease